jgi:hypothetical protein
MLHSPELIHASLASEYRRSESPLNTITESSASVLSFNDTVQKDLLPRVCDVLFAQASYDMGHLSFLESLYQGHFPLGLAKSTLRLITATAEMRVKYLTESLNEIEKLEAEIASDKHSQELCDLLSDCPEDEYCYLAI